MKLNPDSAKPWSGDERRHGANSQYQGDERRKGPMVEQPEPKLGLGKSGTLVEDKPTTKAPFTDTH